MNPAYVIRQMMDEYTELYGVKGRIVSLKPFRKENTPDPWEREALFAFEKGVKEVFEITRLDGKPYLRLMRPMITKKGCLKCHAFQGYKVGDVRGGVGVSVPMTDYLEKEQAFIKRMLLTHGVIWLLGCIGVASSNWRGYRADLKQAKTYSALEKSERQYSDLYDNAPDMYVSVDAKTALVKQCNQTTATMLGHNKDDIIGSPILSLYHPDSHENANKAFQLFINTGQVNDAELQLMKKDGTSLDVSLNVSAVRDDEGNILYSRSIWRDIQQRKHAEHELAKTQHYLRNIIDSMPSMLVGVNNQGMITHWNHEAERMNKRVAAQAVGLPLATVLPQFENKMNEIYQAIGSRQPQMMERIKLHQENDIRYFDVMIYPLVENAEMGAVVRVDDITDRVRMELLMTQTEKMMSVGGLAAGMAHELNNPLGGILQGLQNVRRRLSSDLAKNRAVANEIDLDLDKVEQYMKLREIDGFMEGIAEAGKRAADVVQNMLNFSHKANLKDVGVQLNH